MGRMITSFCLCFWICLCSTSLATETKLTGESEARARALFSELRCVVCQNQSIGDSDADVAKDLRVIVRELVAEGKSNEDVKSYLVARYGEFVLLKPSWGLHTILLWTSPILFLFIGAFLAFSASRKPSTKVSEELSQKEKNELAKLIEDT